MVRARPDSPYPWPTTAYAAAAMFPRSYNAKSKNVPEVDGRRDHIDQHRGLRARSRRVPWSRSPPKNGMVFPLRTSPRWWVWMCQSAAETRWDAAVARRLMRSPWSIRRPAISGGGWIYDHQLAMAARRSWISADAPKGATPNMYLDKDGQTIIRAFDQGQPRRRTRLGFGHGLRAGRNMAP